MTAAVWIKGILAEHYGIPVNSVSYHTGGLKEPGRREMPLQLPDDIRIEAIPAGRTLSDMLERGEIDALYTAEAPETFEQGSTNVRRLFENHADVEREFFRQTGLFPIMHTVVLRRDIYEQNHWVAQSLTKAFSAAQQIAYRELREMTALKLMLPWLLSHLEDTVQAMGSEDFWPYGIARNRETLSTFLRYSFEQGLSPRLIEPEELFAPETIETSRT
jgi:4,5-dihydroxyphthalate decarboxylase